MMIQLCHRSKSIALAKEAKEKAESSKQKQGPQPQDATTKPLATANLLATAKSASHTPNWLVQFKNKQPSTLATPQYMRYDPKIIDGLRAELTLCKFDVRKAESQVAELEKKLETEKKKRDANSKHPLPDCKNNSMTNFRPFVILATSCYLFFIISAIWCYLPLIKKKIF
jgi:hypothetical protein